MSDMKQLDDSDIIKRAIAGEQDAYTELMSRYKTSVYFVVLKIVNNNSAVAEDLTIETFAKAFKKIGRYNLDYTFSTLLFKIAINLAIDSQKKRASSFIANSQNDELNSEERFVKSLRLETLKGLAAKLSPKYRELIQLRYFEELSYLKIAERIEMPVGTVKARLHRAKKLLKRILETDSSEDVDD